MSEKYSAIIASLLESHTLYRKEQEKKMASHYDPDMHEKYLLACKENEEHMQRIELLSQQLSTLKNTLAKDSRSQNILHGEQIQIMAEIADANHRRLMEVQERLTHIESTKSWRWTAPYRKACAVLSRSYRKTLRTLLYIPRTLFGLLSITRKKLPKTSPQESAKSHERVITESSPHRVSYIVDVTAVIYCDNTELLQTTIQSLSKQSSLPERIIVLDTTSSIQSKDIAPVYDQYQTITVIHDDWDNETVARNAATPYIQSKYTIYLRCGDAMQRHCIRQQIQTLEGFPDSPFCYGSAHYYGKRTSLVHTPDHMNVSYVGQSTHIEVSTLLFRSQRLKNVLPWNSDALATIASLLGNGYGHKSAATYFLHTR